MAGGHVVDTGKVKNYKGGVTLFVVFACVLGASGGLIFGYDIGISGCFNFFLYFFITELTNKGYSIR